MTNLWFNNPKILFQDLNEFFPDKDLHYNNKINSLVRFAIYYTFLLILFNCNLNYLYISLFLILFSYYLGYYKIEKFNQSDNIIPLLSEEQNKNNLLNEKNNLLEEQNINLPSKSEENSITKICYHPTENNPFMNYTLGDQIDNPNRPKACEYDDVKNEIRKEYRKDLYTDTSDIWGKYISDRNFYTMSNTESINKQKEFAEWVYGGHGDCKSFGIDCLKQRDPTYHKGRIVTNLDDNPVNTNILI